MQRHVRSYTIALIMKCLMGAYIRITSSRASYMRRMLAVASSLPVHAGHSSTFNNLSAQLAWLDLYIIL